MCSHDSFLPLDTDGPMSPKMAVRAQCLQVGGGVVAPVTVAVMDNERGFIFRFAFLALQFSDTLYSSNKSFNRIIALSRNCQIRDCRAAPRTKSAFAALEFRTSGYYRAAHLTWTSLYARERTIILASADSICAKIFTTSFALFVNIVIGVSTAFRTIYLAFSSL
jgi:hypothetical protein